MSLAKITFWISPLTNKINVGFLNRKSGKVIPETRDITGLMVNGVVEVMRKSNATEIVVTQDGVKYNLKLTKVSDE